jgi:hypothetical protein
MLMTVMRQLPFRKSILCVAATLLVVAAIILYSRFDPALTAWMPGCPLKAVTGLDCPACGLQRALHAMLHGDFARAWSFNPFLFAGLTYLLMSLWGNCSFLPGSGGVCRAVHSPIMAYGYIALFFIWWIIRNL